MLTSSCKNRFRIHCTLMAFLSFSTHSIPLTGRWTLAGINRSCLPHKAQRSPLGVRENNAGIVVQLQRQLALPQRKPTSRGKHNRSALSKITKLDASLERLGDRQQHTTSGETHHRPSISPIVSVTSRRPNRPRFCIVTKNSRHLPRQEMRNGGRRVGLERR